MSGLDAGDLGDAAKSIPPAGWAAIIGGGVIVGLLLRGRLASHATTTVPDLATIGAPASAGVTSGGTVFASGTGSQPVASSASYTTNHDWLQAAETNLIAKGIDAGTADSGLRKYLSGDDLTAAETAAVKLALSSVGTPPEGAPVPHFALAPSSTSTAPSSGVPGRSGFLADDAAYVDFLYRTILHREPDPVGRNYWIGRSLAPGMTDAHLAAEFSAASGSELAHPAPVAAH
jgi:hypothetical protein